MPWFHKMVPEYIKKSVCTCLIKRYLSQFIENEITRDQLNLDLYNGRGTAERISLAVEALNELGETQNWPLEFVDGYIEKIYINVPWISILKDPTFVEIKGLKITVQPKQRNEDATSMFESMWNSMTSSMHLAEEFAKEEVATEKNTQPFEGVELFAQTIESIVGRIKIKFIDTTIQVEHVPKESIKGVGIVINIDLMEYSDESGNDPSCEEATDLTNEDTKKAYLIQSFTTKKFNIQGVKLSSVEFSSDARTFSRSVIQSQYGEIGKETVKEDDQFFDTDNEDKNMGKNHKEDLNSKKSDELDSNRHVIMFGRFYSKQEVRVRLKQSENLNGPKVAIEINLGSLVLFLSPRQFHILAELANGFSSPSMEDTSNVAPRSKCTSKPMTDMDYQKVEQELQSLLNPLTNFQGTGLQMTQGWATGAMDESADDSFLPMRDAVSGMYDSTMSGNSSSMESSMTSSIASSTMTDQSHRTLRRVNNIDADPTAEISRFQIRLASLALILLHEDLLALPAENENILVKQMQNIANDFFGKLGFSVPLDYSNKDFENTNALFNKIFHLNHLRLLAAPLQIEADEKTTLSAFSITGQLVVSKLELLECLYNNGEANYVPLLNFTSGSCETDIRSSTKPSVKLKFKHIEKTGKSLVSKHGPKTDVMLALNKCALEFDISIVDRITALLNHPPICVKEKKDKNKIWYTNNAHAQFISKAPTESRLDFKITSPSINLKIRFPIPDFRPPHDMSKIPWWERHIRPDYLSLILSEVVIQSIFQSKQDFQEYSVEASGLDIFYYESENSPGLHIGKCNKDDKKFSSIQDSLQNLGLSIKIFPKKNDYDEGCEMEQDPMTHSCYGAFENQSNYQPGPFTPKRVVHESDTPHSKLHKDDSEELIIPGDNAEIDEFIKSTSSCSRIQLEIFLPTISAHLKSKHIYELIYNRINNDLLLWEPGAPKPTNVFDSTQYSTFPNLDGQDRFLMCKSAIKFESDGSSDEDFDGDRSNVFYSTYEGKMKYSQRSHTAHKREPKGQTCFILTLKIGQGLLCLNPPVRDGTTNNVIPGQQGEFLLNIEDANIFVVSGYKGDEDLGYVCVQMHKAMLYHCDMQATPSSSPPLRDIGCSVGKHLHPTIYKSEPGMLTNSKNRGGNREMFTVAVKIQANHETHHVKTIQVSLGLNKGTLRHRMCNEPNTWISHMLDFFNVQDYPVPGYHAKEVLTEFHLHLWDCAIDYRPLNLPLRAALCVGNFSMSSHLNAAANTSTLRFIFEECGLFLSEKAPPRHGVASMAAVDLKRDYVNVVELGLFEISLKTTDKKIGINPHIDLRASNNMVNIRTCSDSGKALMELITYFANDGDLTNVDQQNEVISAFSSPKHHVEEELISVEPQEMVILSKSQQAQVSELLVEAMEDSERQDIESSDDFPVTGAKLFFFPDERDIIQDPPAKPLPQVTTELGDVTYHFGRNNDTDDEFCFVTNEIGLGLFPKDGIPEIRWLTDDPVKINDNHFSIPVGKKNLLQPPKHFPTPVMRYTLCEMSIVWQMYGGHDFKVPEHESQKKEVRFSETQLNDVVSFSKNKHVTIKSHAHNKRANVPWMRRGGVDRDNSVLMELQLNKVRFQHEVYPETTMQASRQVLLVSDVEIRDRLESSQINKFLYQYTSESRPKKSHSNMIVVKALHMRPDPKLKTQECCLKVSLLPIRLNIDQDSLLFLITFFKELGGETAATKEVEQTPSSKHNTPTHQPPVMTISTGNEEEIKQQAQKVVNENLILLMEESKMHFEPGEKKCDKSTDSVSDDTPIYFRKVVFSPDVFIRLDYHGKSHESVAGLFMSLVQLNCTELRLKRIIYRHGLLGFSKLIYYLVQEWLSDIKKTQLSAILGGVGPMHALLQLFQGVRDLFWLPIEQYQKDGRIVRGLQRGANSFTTSTAMAALELTTRIIYLIQITAETAYDMLSPGPSIRSKRMAKIKGRKKRHYQPQDIREGLTNACLVVKEGIGETADNICQVASQEKEQKGYSGAVGGVLRQIPSTIIKPFIIASEATTNVLGGMQSQLVPDARREANQKWRSDDI